MKNLALYALSIAASALLAGCGGSQPQIGVRGALPQTSALAVRTDHTHYKVVYSFGAPPDGNTPTASLIDVGGTLYGTTNSGGAGPSCGSSSDGGTVFSLTPSGMEKVLHTFAGNGSDGCNPQAALIDLGGTLYGTTHGGGMYGCGIYSGYNYDPCGTVFRITPGGKEKVLHYFGRYDSDDGDSPAAPLIAVKGTLYGTASQGGGHFCAGSGYQFHCGAVFAVTLTGIEKVLYDFSKRTNGHFPRAGLVHVGRTLYGTTSQGGSYSCDHYRGCGTVFSLTTGGKEKTLYFFGSGSDGRFPRAGPIEINGMFYGTTAGGGSYSCNGFYPGCGTIFSITVNGTEKVLHSFGSGSDGSAPLASLIDVKGTLYGTTSSGGTYGYGTVFSISTTGTEKVLHSFGSGSDGSTPQASLIDVKGTLYGTTSRGGTHGDGTVFALTP
ncbi:MAG: choice-of-anchor tandem repeat GloVer-containing protein [Candidatus Cybelea sp.]